MEQDRASPIFRHYPKLARQPLVSYETVIQLIGATHTRTGLTVQARLDQHTYPIWIKISDDQMAHVQLLKNRFTG